MVFFHLLISSGIGARRHHNSYRTNHTESFAKRLSDPANIGITIIGSLLLFSPLYVFKRKVPQQITFNGEEQTLMIQKRNKRKPQTIGLEGAGFHYYRLFLFSVLEIYHDFETRNGTLRKRYLTILIPMFGMSISDRDLQTLVSLLKQSGVQPELNVKKRTWTELVWE